MSFIDGLKELLGEQVEIYCGQSKRTLKFSDYDIMQKTVIRGKLVDLQGDCLVVECERLITEDNMPHKNRIYINTWSVTAICVPDNYLSITDMFIDEHKKQKK